VSVLVKLSVDDVIRGAAVGFLREVESIKKGLVNKHGYKGKDEWETHIMGALAELAVANYLGVPWNEGINTFSAPDIDPDIQVRCSKREYQHRLTVRPKDKDNERFVLVNRMTNYNYELLGWILGKDAKHPDYSEDPGDRGSAFFVPFENLNDIKTLIIE
jgi:hypothetical protein